jgi:ADP-heptose:LPS heptosyltransferase
LDGFLAIADRGIGDALTLLPSLRSLRAARPDLRMELLAAGLFPLADNLRDVVTMLDHRPLAELTDEERLAWLKQRRVRWVWNTEGERGPWTRALGSSACATWISAPAQRSWGHRNVLRVRFEQLRVLFPELGVPGDYGLSLTPEQDGLSRAFRAGFPPDHVLLAIQPGAGDVNRIWPAEKFRELAAELATLPRVIVLLFLSDQEVLFRRPGYLPTRQNLCWISEPLEAVLPKLAACDLLIGNDSGFYHLAFALGLRVVGIFRSVRSARRWAHRSPSSRVVRCWMPHQLDADWARWVSVQRVLRAATQLLPAH